MRPVNLIPVEERSGEHRPLRSGPLAYILVGALVLSLAGVTALVLTSNEVAERESEVAKLESEDAAAKAEAERLTAYTQFQALHEQRLATIASLADSRFDWERVMRELSLVLPHDVWLSSLDASASGGSGESSGASVAGPSMQISGCATGHEGVAGFVTALKGIDGVTRVEMESSELATREEGSGSTGSESGSSGGDGSCQTREFISQFSMTVAFDAAPLPLTDSESSAPISATEQSEAAAGEVSGEDEESEEGSE